MCPGGSSFHTLLGVGNKYVFFTTASQLHKMTLECLQSLSKREIHKINALPTQMLITNAGAVALKQWTITPNPKRSILTLHIILLFLQSPMTFWYPNMQQCSRRWEENYLTTMRLCFGVCICSSYVPNINECVSITGITYIIYLAHYNYYNISLLQFYWSVYALYVAGNNHFKVWCFANYEFQCFNYLCICVYFNISYSMLSFKSKPPDRQSMWSITEWAVW